MANTSKINGFVPVGYLNGAPWSGGGNVYYIPSGDTNAYAIGDVVTLAGSADANGVPSVSIGVAGATTVGVIVATGVAPAGGHYGDPNSLNTTVIPATKTQDYYVMVVDDPQVVFEVQETASGGTALAATNVGENIDFVAGTNNGYVSGFYIDNANHDTTSTRNCKLLRLAPKQGNAIGAAAKWWVVINNHALRTGVAGV